MRIDKFLKVSRLIKRRTVANEACDKERISVNGKVVKASYDVKQGDVIAIQMGERLLKVQVLEADKEHVTKENAPLLYRQFDE
ncbi:MAG: RNA-binding S4 domain-containing protein [Clostridia bacterium]|nr:RNA-binding S4 domain-containing protein [Clostridia bacterium]